MKATIQKLACLCLGLLLVSIGLAQSNYQAYWVHEDHVIPAKLQEYEQVSKEFVEACNKNNIKDLSFITMATDDFRYAYIGGIENMASLDKNSFAEMQEKMGAEAFGNMMSRMDKCYTDHVDYVLNLDPELSYMPDGMTQMPEAMNYRNNTIYYVSPANYSKANDIAKRFKKLFSEKNSKMHYRVYRSGFGAPATFFLVAIAAKSPAHYETMNAENVQLLGEAGAKLNAELMSIISDMEPMRGYMRPDLSYAPAEK